MVDMPNLLAKIPNRKLNLKKKKIKLHTEDHFNTT